MPNLLIGAVLMMLLPIILWYKNKLNSNKTDHPYNPKTQHNLIDISGLDKTAEMLDEELYWTIVDKSLRLGYFQFEQQQSLIKQISKLSPKQMIGFRLRTDKLLYDIYTSEMWCAAYIMNGGCSDDSFEYFRNWVISRGKDIYYKAKENPDRLIEEVTDELEHYGFEDFWYVALTAFRYSTGDDLYEYIDYDNFTTSERNYPNFAFTWEEDDPESLKRICPMLFNKMWHTQGG